MLKHGRSSFRLFQSRTTSLSRHRADMKFETMAMVFCRKKTLLDKKKGATRAQTALYFPFWYMKQLGVLLLLSVHSKSYSSQCKTRSQEKFFHTSNQEKIKLEKLIFYRYFKTWILTISLSLLFACTVFFFSVFYKTAFYVRKLKV